MKTAINIFMLIVVTAFITPVTVNAATDSMLSATQVLSSRSWGNWANVGVVDLTVGGWVWSGWFNNTTRTVSYTLWYDHWLFGAVWDDYYGKWGEGVYLVDKNL